MSCNCDKDFPYRIGDRVKIVIRHYCHRDIESGKIGTIVDVGFSMVQPGLWTIAVDFDDGSFVDDIGVDEIELATEEGVG